MAKTKAKAKTKIGLLPLLLAAISIIAAILFVLPQIAQSRIIGEDLSISGFDISFGNDNVPGQFLFFIPLVLGIITAAIMLALLLNKKIKAKTIYLLTMALTLASVVIYIIIFITIKDVNIGNNLIPVYYYRLILDSNNGGWTPWFFAGAVCHLLAFAGSVFGITKSK